MPEPSRVRMRDIAERAGVSTMTVSAVLSGKSGSIAISEPTRQRVLALAHEMGYRPNQAARALVTGRTGMVEFWVRNVRNPYFNAVYHLARRQLQQRGLTIVLFETARHTAADMPPPWSADGILLCDWIRGVTALQELLAAHGASHLPLVSMGAYYTEHTDFVGIDLYGTTVEAIRHLLSMGCKRIGYLVDEGANADWDARWQAYTTTVKQAGQPTEYILVREGGRADTRRAVKEYVRAHGCPDGIFCHNDAMAIGAYRGLCDLGLQVPNDVALVGCDGIEDAEYLEHPLSTIAQPIEPMCVLACQFLHARMADPSLPPQQTILQPRLVIRDSSRRQA